MNDAQLIEELEEHVKALVEDGILTPENLDDWHFHAFNETPYIIGYYNASEWLKKHDVDPFEGIRIAQEYERENFGADSVRTYDNEEDLANMLAYILGEEAVRNVLEEMELDDY